MKLRLVVFYCFLALASSPVTAADDFKLVDGDRVVLLGNTLIEREQSSGYWETALTRRYPDRNIVFRNLGWSGDTVFGTSRAGFGSVADGFHQLKDHVLALKPTVIIVGYGSNESFEGEAGLPHFLDGLSTLLDTLTSTRARIVLLSPQCQEDLGRPLPDPTSQNQNLRVYRDALHKVAGQRGCLFVDFYQLLGDGTKATPPSPFTDNGIHLTPYGYWRAAAALEQGLGLPSPRWLVELDANGKATGIQGARIEKVQPSPLRFLVTDATLPASPPPEHAPPGASLPGTERLLRVRGLPPGKYALTVDGKTVAEANAEDWAAGVKLTRGPEFDQVEKLRATIIEKNHLYFYRWRPQNETYLFGFRKHEQGQNAREIPLFDPLVAEQEAAIARFRLPVSHQYAILPQPEVKK